MAGTLDLRSQRRLATAALLDGEAEALEEWRKIPRQERCAICLALIPDWLSRIEKHAAALLPGKRLASSPPVGALGSVGLEGFD
jgi:hypothetical protein